ncbi:MAG: hypothetical protein XU10_C0025G0004 [Chloroflexi bacterium CSP1-4]|nr:MAG: hypothetical protein XU10_C0025G0004 [Chloroflexi bacterium CSP1-4]
MTLPRATVVRPMAALGLVLSLVLAACGGASATPTPTPTPTPAPTPTATPTPEPTPEPTPAPTSTQGTGGTGLSGAAAALENLTSYRFAISISGDIGVAGIPTDTGLAMEGTVVLKPERAVQFSITGMTGETAITYILVADGAYVDFGTGTFIQVPADEANAESLFETFQPQNLFGQDFGALIDSSVATSEEEKNGVASTHYHADKDSPGGAALVATYGQDAVFDAWIAKEGGYLVSVHLVGGRLKAGVAVPFEIGFDISHLDDPANVVEAPRM